MRHPAHVLGEGIMASPEKIESLPDARHFGSQLRRLLLPAPLAPAGREACLPASSKLDPPANRARGAYQIALWQRAHAFCRHLGHAVEVFHGSGLLWLWGRLQKAC